LSPSKGGKHSWMVYGEYEVAGSKQKIVDKNIRPRVQSVSQLVSVPIVINLSMCHLWYPFFRGFVFDTKYSKNESVWSEAVCTCQ